MFTFGIVNKCNGVKMVFYHNYVNQCNKKNLSPSAAAEAMGFKRSMVTRWANGSKPRQATIQRMVDFFGCSEADLMEETKKTPSEDGAGMDSFTYAAHGYSGRLTDADKATLIKMMETLAAANEEKDGQTGGGLQGSD